MEQAAQEESTARSDEIAALSAMYTAQRADGSSTASVAMALLGSAIVYITATLAFLEQIFESFTWAGAFIPIPLWIIAAYHSLITTTSMVRSLATRALEYELIGATRFTDRQAFVISSDAQEAILNVTEAERWPHRAASFFAYGGIVVSIILFTIYMIVRSPLPTWGTYAVGLLYLLVSGMVAASWIAGFKLYDECAEMLDKPAKAKSRNTFRTVITIVLTFIMGVVAVDSLAGLGYRTSTTASVHVTEARLGNAVETLIVFPGYISSGELINEAFRPYLAADQAMIVVGYPERGLDDDGIYQLVMEQLNRIRPQRVRVLSASMGGIVAIRFLSRYRDHGTPYGQVVLVLDTVPGGAHDIHRPQWMFQLSSWYRGGPLTSIGWAAISQLVRSPGSESGADQKLIKRGDHAGAWVGMPALTSQAAYLAMFSSAEIPPIAGVVSRATYLHGVDPGQDGLVKVNESIAEWRQNLPFLQVVSLPDRPGRWHVPWISRPREIVHAANAV